MTPQYDKDVEILAGIQKGATKMVQRLEHLSYEEKWRELGLFHLEKKWLSGILLIYINT